MVTSVHHTGKDDAIYLQWGTTETMQPPTSKNDNNAHTCNPTPAHIIHIHVGCHALIYSILSGDHNNNNYYSTNILHMNGWDALQILAIIINSKRILS